MNVSHHHNQHQNPALPVPPPPAPPAVVCLTCRVVWSNQEFAALYLRAVYSRTVFAFVICLFVFLLRTDVRTRRHAWVPRPLPPVYYTRWLALEVAHPRHGLCSPANVRASAGSPPTAGNPWRLAKTPGISNGNEAHPRGSSERLVRAFPARTCTKASSLDRTSSEAHLTEIEIPMERPLPTSSLWPLPLLSRDL